MNTFPRITFGMIVLNGEPFLRYNLQALYPFAHQIIVVEGATVAAAANATPDGHSLDSTLETLQQFKASHDPENKLIIVTRDGFWSEKDEMSQAYAELATGDYLWQVDVDEFYQPDDMQRVIDMLRQDPTISGMTFEMITFWGSPDYVTDGWFLRRGAKYYHRLFQWKPGYIYRTHRPPTVLDETGTDLRQKHWLDASATRGIRMYHYSLLLPIQVHSKSVYYDKAQWIKAQDFAKWASEVYDQLKDPFRVHNWYQLPSWLERFQGTHPPQFQQMWQDLTAGQWSTIQLRQTHDIERIVSSRQYALKRLWIKMLDYPDRNPFLRRVWRSLNYRLVQRVARKDQQIQPVIAPDGRRLLNLGCGDRFHFAWTNIDHISSSKHVIAMDITQPLPFDAGMFDVVYHSHVIEHLHREQARKLLQECLRLLRPGGMVRIVAPDLEFSAQLYLQALQTVVSHDDPVQREHYEWALLNLIDQMVRIQSGGQIRALLEREQIHDLDYIIENGGGDTIRETRDYLLANQSSTKQSSGESRSNIDEEVQFRRKGEIHLWMYDRYSLRQLLSQIGFVEITEKTIDSSEIADWNTFNLDIDPSGRAFKPHSLVFEAKKP